MGALISASAVLPPTPNHPQPYFLPFPTLTHTPSHFKQRCLRWRMEMTWYQHNTHTWSKSQAIVSWPLHTPPSPPTDTNKDSQHPDSCKVMEPSSGIIWLLTRSEGITVSISLAFWRPSPVLRKMPKPMSNPSVLNCHLQIARASAVVHHVV